MSDPYKLLKQYLRTAKVKSKAYSYSERYYRSMYKYLTYPIIITSALSSIMAGIGDDYISHYFLLIVSLSTLILSGFNTAINPKEKENLANHLKVEFGEIASNIEQFIYENSKTRNEIKSYTSTVHELMNVWNGQCTPIKDKFITQAEQEILLRVRNSDSTKKKDEYIP